jgi:hypothetical protein
VCTLEPLAYIASEARATHWVAFLVFEGKSASVGTNKVMLSLKKL